MAEVLDPGWQQIIASAIDHQVTLMCHAIAEGVTLPSVLYRPKLSRDGNQWCALYGDNLQDGIAGFGSSPAAAMEDFDRAWFSTITQEAGRG